MKQSSLLIVDDTPANIDVLGDIFMDHHRIQVATNGPDALEIAGSGTPPDIILLDMMMPDMDGFQVLKELKSKPETSEIPVIFVTACTSEAEEKLGFEAGCVDYLHKPVTPMVARSRVETHLELKRHRDLQEKLLKSSKEEASLKDTYFRNLFQNSPLGIILMDHKGAVKETNQGFRSMFGFRKDTPVNSESLSGILPKKEIESYNKQIERIIEGSKINMETVRLNMKGESLDVSMHGYPVITSGETKGICIIYEDISRRKQFECRLRHQAYHDELTGIANRARFMQGLKHAIEKAKKGSRVSVMLMDLDRFKGINDTMGHSAGDLLIREVARRFSTCFRECDLVARIGGDEFAVIVSGINTRKEISNLADRVRKAAARPFEIQGRQVYIGVSIGVVEDVSEYTLPEEILRDADLAMYRSKENGKDRHTLFNPELRQRAVMHLEMESELYGALEKGEFSLRYQPVTHIKSGKTTGFEALIRWEHPARGMISPDKFIPVAEETGLIVPIGRWVITEACRQLGKWVKIDPDITVNVNLSTRELVEPGLIKHIKRALKNNKLEASSLNIEITETVLMTCRDRAMKIIKALKKMKAGVAMDDFGTGYSSLSYLHDFPLDTLKIDRSFISRMDPEGLEIVKAIIVMADSLGLKVVAEGVETRHQRDLLKRSGCSHMQGYFVAPPVTREKAQKMICNQT